MPTKAVKKITSWSYSRYNAYSKCPKFAMFKFVLGLKEPGNKAMDRGNVIHKLAEQYTLGKMAKLPPELKLFKDEFASLRKQPTVECEQSWTYKADWSMTKWNDWDNAWLRIKVDAAYTVGTTLKIIDHKTGRQNDAHVEQLSLYAMGGFLAHPKVKKAISTLWYLDQGEDPEDVVFESKELPALQKDWLKKIKPMVNDTVFKENPGNACTYCHFRKANGGPCKF